MLLVSETFCNATKGFQFDDSAPYEPFTDDVSRLFKSYRREFGRAGKVYVDKEDGPSHVGWCFTKRTKYEDDHRRHYTREVWVSFYAKCDANDERACVSRYHDGRITRHPYRALTVAEARKLAAD